MALPETPDVNALLAEEQSAVMRADSAGSSRKERAMHRDSARNLRHLLDQAGFPSREPHHFEREAADVASLERQAADIRGADDKIDDGFGPG